MGEIGVVAQLRVIFALIMREMATRFGRSAGGYIWAVLEPVGAIALLTAVFSQIGRHPPLGDDFALFFATGYIAFHVYMDVSRTVSLSVQVNRPLLTFPRITLLDTIIARFLLQTITSLVVGAAIVAALIALNPDRPRLDLAPILHAAALAALLGLGVGAVNCVLFSYFSAWERIFGIVNRPLFLISGVFFLYEDMPPDLRDLLWFNPLVHVTALMRRGFYPTYHAEFVEPVFVAGLALLLLALGGLLLRALRADILEQS